MLALVVLMTAGFLLQTKTLYHFLSTQANVSVWNIMIIGFIALVGIAFLVFLFRTDRIYHPMIEKIKNKLSGFIDGVLSLSKTKSPWELATLSIGIWLMYYAMTILGLKAFGPTSHITWVQGLIVFIIGTLGMVVPTPGGLGPFHLLTMSALSIYGISKIDGFSYANLSFFVIQVVTISIFGIIGMTYLSKKKNLPK